MPFPGGNECMFRDLINVLTFILTVGLLLAVAETASADRKEITGDALKSILSGNTYVGVNPRGSKFTIYYDPSGEMRGKYRRGDKSGTDAGKWTVEGGQYCPHWKKWRKGKKECHTAFMEGDRIWLENPEAKLNSNGIIKKGNPDNL